jgi:hypothetical protein
MANPFSAFQAVVTALQNIAKGVNSVAVIAKSIRATSAQFTSNATGVILTPSSYWTAQGEQNLTDASTVSIDLSKGVNFVLAATAGVGATRSLGNPTNTKVGQRGYIRYVQSSGGSNALTFGSEYQAAGGISTIVASSGANNVDLLLYTVLPGPIVFLSIAKTISH